MSDFVRNCPNLECNREIKYKSKESFDICKKLNRICKSCSNHNRTRGTLLQSAKEKISKANTGKKRTKEYKRIKSILYKGKNNPNFGNGIKITGNKNGMYGSCRQGKENPFYNRKHTENSKIKMRISFLKRKESQLIDKNTGLRAFYNSWACVYADALSLDMNLNFQHALNGGEHFIEELGYFIDGYDFKNNIVFEYNEVKHYIGNKLKPRDNIRLIQIKSHLNCQMYVYNEKKNKLEEWL